MIDNNEKNLGNKPQGDSYTELEKIIRSSQYSKNKPTDAFRGRLLAELKHKAFNEASMKKTAQAPHQAKTATDTAEKPVQESEGKTFTWPMQMFTSFKFIPITMGSFAVVVLIAVLAVSFALPNKPDSDTPTAPIVINTDDTPVADLAFALKPSDENATGINPATEFELTSATDTSAEAVQNALTFEPAASFTIAAISPKNYTVKPDQPLPADSIVKVTLSVATKTDDGTTTPKNFTWAYQVQEKFQIVSTLPRDKATYVRVNTGIEVTFSHKNFEKLEQNFHITPEVKGRLEIHGETVAFVPEQPLQLNTYYRVTIGKDVTLPATGETLEKDYTFGFATEEEDSSQINETPTLQQLEQKTMETTDEEAPRIRVSGYNMEQLSEVDLKIYRFPDRETYQAALAELSDIPAWAYSVRNSWKTDVSKLQLHSDTKVKLENQSYWEFYIQFPGKLDEGFYAVEVGTDRGETVQSLMTISNLTSYSTVSETETLVWLHNNTTDKPIADAKITLNADTELGSTDDNGMLRVPTPQFLLDHVQDMTGFLKMETGENVIYTPLLGYDSYGNTLSDIERVKPYWSYLYTDQPIYRTTDTINFWGVIKNRDTEEVPEKITVSLVRHQDGYWSEKQSVISKQEVTPDKIGAFQGAIGIDNVPPDYAYAVEVRVGDEILYVKYLTIQTYTKPLYKLSITPKTQYVIRNETLTHTISANFFDGTPVANLKLDTSGGMLTTDAQGKAKITKTYDGEDSQYWISDDLFVNPQKAEEAEINASASVTILPGEKLIKINGESKGNHATMTGTIHRADLEKLNDGKEEPNSIEDDGFGETLPNEKVTLKVVRTWYTERQTDTSYDFISKKTIPMYAYDSHEETVQTQEVTTNAKGEFSLEFDMLEGSSYQTIATVTDEKGRASEMWAYAYAEDYQSSYDMFGDSAYLEFGENGSDRALEKSIGDDVNVKFMRKNELLPETGEGNFLFIQAREGIRDVTLSPSPEYNFTFEEKDIPNILLQGIWYDGTTYWATDIDSPYMGMGFNSGLTVSFKEQDRKLDIDVQSDKETYKPGDTVRLDFTVKTPDGQGTQADLNVNLIDEAIYAVMEANGNYDIDFLSDLYKDVRSGIYTRYTSHTFAINPGGAEGGGGSNEPRSNFQDKALFVSVETDAEGQASTEFTLPDNLTSWRVTTHALNEDYYAGDHTDAVVVKQPFFVDAVVSSTYMLGDDPKIKVRTFGEELSAKDGVEISVSSKSLGMEPVNVSATGLASVDIDLPDLTVGTHTLLISGKTGEKEDAIERKFTVLPSQLVLPQSTSENVTTGWKPAVEGGQSFDVVFSDQNIGKYYNAIMQLSYSHGERLDNQAARFIATQLENRYFGGDETAQKVELLLYSPVDPDTGGGGLTILPYSDEDLLLTASMAASSMSGELDQGRLVKYFESILYDETQTTLRHAQSLYGLAALKQPVLLEIDAMLASDQITDVDRLYLSLAKAELGDQDGARAIYAPLIEKYGKRDDEIMHVELGAGEEVSRNTLVAAHIAALIDDENSDRLFNYVQSKPEREILLDLQKTNFIEDRIANLPQSPVKINYRHLGEEKTVELKHGETELVTLTPATAPDFEVTAVEGNALATVNSLRAGTAEEFGKDDRLSIERSFEKEKLGENEIIRVTLNVNINDQAPEGAYEVTDFVPAGMRIIAQPFNYLSPKETQNLDWPYQVNGQRISFLVFDNDGQDTIEYYIRPITKGTYKAGTPLLRSSEAPSVRTFGNENTVTIE